MFALENVQQRAPGPSLRNLRRMATGPFSHVMTGDPPADDDPNEHVDTNEEEEDENDEDPNVGAVTDEPDPIDDIEDMMNIDKAASNVLHEILPQFVSEDDIEAVIGRFERYLSSHESDLGVHGDSIANLYNWIFPAGNAIDLNFQIIATIALRLEPLLCAEAVTERAISVFRKILCDDRMRAHNDNFKARLIVMQQKPTN
jgi:hypothetical protein